MSSLESIALVLDCPQYCKFTPNGKYPVMKQKELVELDAKEVLNVGRTDPREVVMVSFFGKDPTRIAYACDNVEIMRETIDALKLPQKYPENLGEKVFYIFRSHVKDLKGDSYICLEQQVCPGKEHQLLFVLAKLIHVYEGNQIDSNFYERWKKIKRRKACMQAKY